MSAAQTSKDESTSSAPTQVLCRKPGCTQHFDGEKSRNAHEGCCLFGNWRKVQLLEVDLPRTVPYESMHRNNLMNSGWQECFAILPVHESPDRKAF